MDFVASIAATWRRDFDQGLIGAWHKAQGQKGFALVAFMCHSDHASRQHCHNDHAFRQQSLMGRLLHTKA